MTREKMKIDDLIKPAGKLPFKIMMTDPASKFAMEDVCNPYSGEMCQLPRYAAEVYRDIKIAEIKEQWSKMRKGIQWFQVHFTKQYYTLLD
jgi:hypothetical protein